MSKPEWVWDDEQAYATVTDELNDEPHDYDEVCGPITLADLEPEVVAMARRYAEANDLPWPPGVGDFDHYYDRKVNS